MVILTTVISQEESGRTTVFRQEQRSNGCVQLYLYLPGLNLTVFKHFLISCLFFSSEDFTDGKAALLKLLIDAEAAGSSAAIQLASFKDAIEDEFSVSVVQFSHPSTWYSARNKIGSWNFFFQLSSVNLGIGTVFQRQDPNHTTERTFTGKAGRF